MNNVENSKVAVSIALCTYNGEKYLVEQIESILSQDCAFLTEIVCVDDNSTDSTWAILTKYADENPMFKIFQNKTNLGYIKNFEKAFSLTKNQYIAISDQDDIWYPNKISKLIEAIGTGLLVYSDNEYIDQIGKPMGLKSSDKRNITACTSCLNFALYNVISGHTILFSRELLNYALPFPADVPYDFWLGLTAAQYGIIPVVNEPLVGYRQHESNVIGLELKAQKDYELNNETLLRLTHFARTIAPHLSREKLIVEKLREGYQNRSLLMRLKRVGIFWKNRDELLLFRRRSQLRKMIYCLKAFWKYD